MHTVVLVSAKVKLQFHIRKSLCKRNVSAPLVEIRKISSKIQNRSVYGVVYIGTNLMYPRTISDVGHRKTY